VVHQVFELVKRIRAGGLTVLIVEQNVQQVLRVVDRAYLLEAGTIRASGKASEMLADDAIRQAYLGLPDPAAQNPGMQSLGVQAKP
jgi:branched-chain amino acid transport system ATP-binding protein